MRQFAYFALLLCFTIIFPANRLLARSPVEPAPTAGDGRAINAPLLTKVERVLDAYYRRPLNTRVDTPWSLIHWSIAFGIDAQVTAPGIDDQPITAIGWLCYNRPAAGQRLMSYDGRSLQLPIAPGLQGHQGQLLSMLAQSQVKADYGIRVGDQELTVGDLVDYEKRTCRSGTELTFKLTGLAHYCDSEETWRNSSGQMWSVQRLLEEELGGPINRSQCACGGLHRLFALSYAVDRRLHEDKPVDGPWLIAERRVKTYQDRALRLQNPDGSFSTLWLDAAQNQNDKTRKLTTSGHILEWLAFSLPEEQLSDARFERAVNFVATLLERNQQTQWHRGALGHALHALVIYEQRVAGTKPGDRRERLALAE